MRTFVMAGCIYASRTSRRNVIVGFRIASIIFVSRMFRAETLRFRLKSQVLSSFSERLEPKR